MIWIIARSGSSKGRNIFIEGSGSGSGDDDDVDRSRSEADYVKHLLKFNWVLLEISEPSLYDGSLNSSKRIRERY